MAVHRAERRLAAILVADVVGYSRLMGRDDAGTLARLKACRSELFEPLVTEHRGRIINLPGDNALCEFASVVDAVSAPSPSSAASPNASGTCPGPSGSPSGWVSIWATSSPRSAASTATG